MSFFSTPCSYVYTVANGEIEHSAEAVRFCSDQFGEVRFQVIERFSSSVPFLLGMDFLKTKKVDVNFQGGVLTYDRGGQRIQRKFEGSQRIPMFSMFGLGSTEEIDAGDDCNLFVRTFGDEFSCAGVCDGDEDQHRRHMREEIIGAVDDPKRVEKLHCALWHYDVSQMCRHYAPILHGDELRRFKTTAAEVVARCAVCKSTQREGHRPSYGIKSTGLNDIVALDTFEVTILGEVHKVLHMIDLFTGFSLAFRSSVTGSDTVSGLIKWRNVFGRCPIRIMMDNGTEFKNALVNAFCASHHIGVHR